MKPLLDTEGFLENNSYLLFFIKKVFKEFLTTDHFSYREGFFRK